MGAGLSNGGLAGGSGGSGGGSGTVTSVTGTAPIVSDGSTTTPTISVTDASASTSGVVTTGTQTLAGAKTLSSVLSSSVASGSTAISLLPGARLAFGSDGVAFVGIDAGAGNSGDVLLRCATGGADIIFQSGSTEIGRVDSATSGFQLVNGPFTSSVASGQVAYRMILGARFVTNGVTATRYMTDDGTNIKFIGSTYSSGNVSADLTIQSNATSGNVGFYTPGYLQSDGSSGAAGYYMNQGQRFYFNGATATRYASYDGTNFVFTGAPVSAPSLVLAGALSGVTTGAFSGAITSTVASGSKAISLQTGGRLVFNEGTDTAYIACGAGPLLSTPVGWAITGGVTVTTKFQSDVASGSDGFRLSVTGARLHLGAGTTDYFTSDGTDIVAAAGLKATNKITTQGGSGTIGFAMSSGTRFTTNSGTDTRYISDDGASILFTGAIRSAATSGSQAFQMVSGAKFMTNTGTDTRWISDDGSFITFTGGTNFSSTMNAAAITTSGLITAGVPVKYKGVASITAFATGGQASATALTGEVNFVTTVATGGDSVKLPVAFLGERIVIYNDGANAMDIFPVSGSSIDALAANAAYSLASGASREFWGSSATTWKSKV